MHTSNPELRRLTPAAPALGAVLVKTAVASALHNAGGHGVRGDAGTVQAVDSTGLNVVHVRRAAATFGGVRGVAGTVPAAAVIPEVRGVAVTPVTDPDPLREAATAADVAIATARAVVPALREATATVIVTAPAVTAARHAACQRVLVTARLQRAAANAAEDTIVAISFATRS